jgi:hypothetical protein
MDSRKAKPKTAAVATKERRKGQQIGSLYLKYCCTRVLEIHNYEYLRSTTGLRGGDKVVL